MSHPFVPGDMLRAKSNVVIRPNPVYGGTVDHRWTKMHKGDLSIVIATGDLKDDYWRWYMLLHSPTMRYGWTNINVVVPEPRNFERMT